MKVLIADDEEDLRELVTLCLQSDYGCEIINVADGRQAIAALDADPEIDVIICDFSMPHANGLEVFQHVNATKHKVKFVLCTGAADLAPFKGPSYAGFIEKPNIFQGLKQVMDAHIAARAAAAPQSAAAVSPPPIASSAAALEWCSMRTDYLLKVNLGGCDLYIKLSDKKYVKIMHGEDVFTEDDAARYAAKKIDRLWIRRNDAHRLLTKLERDLAMITKARELDLESSFEISKMALDTVHGLSKQLGFTPQVRALTKTSVELAVKSITSQPHLADLFRRITMNPDEYLASHSVALALTACGMAAGLGWNSDYSFFKLSLAAFLHDLPLDNDLSFHNSMESLVRARAATGRTVSAEEEARFMGHPAEAAKLVAEMKASLPDVELIVRQHHERPDGSGFPERLNHPQISPLAAVLILAEDLVAFAYSKGPGFLLTDFLAQRGSLYSSGQFKKIMSMLTNPTNAK